ncbi:DUF4349 domain-containing protein [Catenulispora sp. NF23]|uniref:DUF4349 domain-containing protein n=1 Tax=Catenulispora pinistramenti TaxID=2705254 RepID=UPI001BA9F32F|nr:DUF4349 domain-containing protein [Catenulispora pinistramenti]MBS2535417.1 DUF4349 domain-containing protein [Catenulispora pinistramenti]
MIVGLSAGCGSGNSNSAASSVPKGAAGAGNPAAGAASGDSAPNQAAAPSAGQNSLAKAPVAGRSIVYSATMTVRTKDVEAATANAETLAEGSGGFVGGENSQSGTVPDVQGLTQSTVTLRVPSAVFEKVIGQLGTGGVVQDETRSASDVTAQVVDTGTRITAQQASIARITDLMKSATNLSDVVTLEGELSRRESDLESMQAQLAALNDQVSLSTITVTFLVPQAASPAATPAAKHQNALQRGLHDGWQAFMGTVKVLLVIIGVLLPFALLAAVLWWPVKGAARLVARLRAGPAAAEVGAPAAADES